MALDSTWVAQGARYIVMWSCAETRGRLAMDLIGMDAGDGRSSDVRERMEAGEVVERQERTQRRRPGDVFGGLPTALIRSKPSTESEWTPRGQQVLGH